MWNEGYVILPLWSIEETLSYRSRVEEVMRHAPEFRETMPSFAELTKETSYMGGATCFYGSPTVAYHSLFHEMRVAAETRAREVLKEGLRANGLSRVEMLYDRLMIRPPNVVPQSESAHVDHCLAANLEDVILGGWINLDSKPQIFTGLPGQFRKRTETRKRKRGESGFSLFSKQEQKELNQQMQKILIPPGHIFLFNECMIHAVTARKLDYTSVRLFLAFRLTNDIEPLFGRTELERRLVDQHTPLIKSGQECRYIPELYNSLHQAKIPRLKAQLDPRATIDMSVKHQSISSVKDICTFSIPDSYCYYYTPHCVN